MGQEGRVDHHLDKLVEIPFRFSLVRLGVVEVGSFQFTLYRLGVKGWFISVHFRSVRSSRGWFISVHFVSVRSKGLVHFSSL